MAVPTTLGRLARLAVAERGYLGVATFLLAGLALIVVVLAITPDASGWGYDFSAYYEASRRLAATGTPYAPATLAGQFRPGPGGLYLYAPPLAIAITPLAQLPFDIATVIWLAARIGLLAAACALIPASPIVRFAVFATAFLSRPVLEDLNLGNVSVVVTFLAVVAWRYLDRPLGSAALASSLMLRPTMALVVGWWVLRGRIRPVLWTAAAAALVVVASVALVGISPWIDYLTVLRNVSDITGVPRNLDLGSLSLRLGAPLEVATLVLLASFVLAGTAVLWSLRRDRELSYVVTLGASLVISPLLWNHYLTNLVVPAAFLAARGRPWGVALPLLCWLPEELVGLVALGALVLPFAAGDRAEPDRNELSFDRLAGARATAAPA